MKSITIPDVDDTLDALIRARARREGRQPEEVIRHILREAFGGVPKEEVDPKKKFRELCGVWSEEEYQEFESAVRDLGEVNPGDWK